MSKLKQAWLRERTLAERHANRADALLQRFQKKCKHPKRNVVETRFEETSYPCVASPPFRVCRECGYAEEGWGCGYWKLCPGEHDIPTVGRGTARTFVVGRILTQQAMAGLGRFGR